MPEITKIEVSLPEIRSKRKVAAYARVSTESEQMYHSLSAQVSYYSSLIQKNPEWEYAGVYADYGISGTGTAKRVQFQEMLAAAERGEIDIILTKSIQRFARNTVDLLNTVRHLKSMGIEVRFEREHINSMSGDGELMLSILASFAQEEARSISDNIKWSIRKRMQAGFPATHRPVIGYNWEGEELIVAPEEANVVRRIFQSYLGGLSRRGIAKGLNTDGITTKAGYQWHSSAVRFVLTNITYTGRLLLQKTFVTDPIEKKRKKNEGELPQYLVESDHEPIIDEATYLQVQNEMQRRLDLGPLAYKSQNAGCFSTKIRCPFCGRNYHHRWADGRKLSYWYCGSADSADAVECPVGIYIPSPKLAEACCDVLGLEELDEDVFLEKVDFISVPAKHCLEFHMYDGTVTRKYWSPTDNHEYWTDERRKQQSEYMRTHRTTQAGVSCFTTKIKCRRCGCNFQRHAFKTGPNSASWYCLAHPKVCGTKGLREDLLKDLTAEVLGLEQFDENVFLNQIDFVDILSPSDLDFVFTDGSRIHRKWGSSRGAQSARK